MLRRVVPPDDPRRLADVDLLAGAEALARRAHGATAGLVAHLAELEERELHLKAGYASLFAYAREALHLSEHAAYLHMAAAGAARRFPVVLDLLADGALNLTNLRLLAPHLTAENHAAVLAAARGRRRAEVEEIAARLAPADAAPPPPNALRQVGRERFELQVTLGRDAVDKLRLARDMLGHVVPSGDDAAVLDRALGALIAELARRKFAAAESPRPPRGTPAASRHVPAEVKRAVWMRDRGRCAFVGEAGRRCEERRFLEFDHVRPHAVGGPPTAENLRLACRAHNAYAWRAFAAEHDGSGRVKETAAAWGA